MSRFSNVVNLLEIAENYNHETLVELLLDEDTSTEELAEDIAFVLISMWALVPFNRKLAFKERLTDEIVTVEISKMFSEEGFKKDTHCRNCACAMWWVPDEGWYHDHPHCIDPDPYLSDI